MALSRNACFLKTRRKLYRKFYAKQKLESKIRLPNLNSVRPETAHHAAKDSRAKSLDRSEGRGVGFG